MMVPGFAWAASRKSAPAPYSRWHNPGRALRETDCVQVRTRGCQPFPARASRSAARRSIAPANLQSRELLGHASAGLTIAGASRQPAQAFARGDEPAPKGPRQTLLDFIRRWDCCANLAEGLTCDARPITSAAAACARRIRRRSERAGGVQADEGVHHSAASAPPSRPQRWGGRTHVGRESRYREIHLIADARDEGMGEATMRRATLRR